MQILPQAIPEVLQEAGIPELVQHNQSRSRRGVLLGRHYQLVKPQGKLMRCARGQVFDVAVDVRRGSPTFGQSVGVLLDDVTHHQLWVPPGFAHGFLVLSEVADFCYLCSEYSHPQSEQGIAWNDPTLGIRWSALSKNTAIQLSAKDQGNPRLAEQAPDHLPASHEQCSKSQASVLPMTSSFSNAQNRHYN